MSWLEKCAQRILDKKNEVNKIFGPKAKMHDSKTFKLKDNLCEKNWAITIWIKDICLKKFDWKKNLCETNLVYKEGSKNFG